MGENYLCTYICGKCCLLITFNIAYLVIGILVSGGSTNKYGIVVANETNEWNKPPVIDMIAVNTTTCPEEYEMVSGVFFGTKNYCKYYTGGYRVGSCRKKEGLGTTKGLEPVSFKKFDGQFVCVKRDKNTDYHQLATMRDSRTCSASSGCGSSLDASKRFCLRGTTKCPPNAFLAYLQNQTT
jgi:hypothetical protein